MKEGNYTKSQKKTEKEVMAISKERKVQPKHEQNSKSNQASEKFEGS